MEIGYRVHPATHDSFQHVIENQSYMFYIQSSEKELY